MTAVGGRVDEHRALGRPQHVPGPEVAVEACRRLLIVEPALGDQTAGPADERTFVRRHGSRLLGDREVGQHAVAGIERTPGRLGRFGQPPNATVGLELDVERFWDLILHALDR